MENTQLMKTIYPKQRNQRFFLYSLGIILLAFNSGCSNISNKIPDFGHDLKETIAKKIDFKGNAIPSSDLKPVQSFKSSEMSRPDLVFAQKHFRLGNFEVAEYYFTKALLQYPQDPDALRELSWSYFYHKNYVMALKYFRKAQTFYPKSAGLLIGKGWTLFALKRYEEAISSFRKAEEYTGSRRQIFKGLAYSFLLMNRQDEARNEFLKIYSKLETDSLIEAGNQWFAESASPSPEIFSFLAEKSTLFSLPIEFPRHRTSLLGFEEESPDSLNEPWRLYGREFYGWAIESFQKEIANGNDTVDARNGLAWSYLRANKINEAEAVFDDILKYLPLFPGALKGKLEVQKAKAEKSAIPKFYFDKNKDQIAEVEFSNLAKKFPNWSLPLIHLGKLKLKGKQLNKAWELFQSAKKLSPDDPEVKNGLDAVLKQLRPKLYKAQLLMEKGDFKKASHIYFDYIDENRNNSSDSFLPTAYNQLGWGQFYKKQYDLASKKFQISLKDADLKIDSAKGAGMSAYNEGDFKKAEELLNIAYRANPEIKEVAYLYDQSVRKGWSWDKAFVYFKDEIRKFPLRASIYMEMGWLIYKQPNPNLAIEYFSKAISLDPEVAVNQEFDQLLRKERFGWQVYNQMGWAFYQKKQFQKSMQMFNIALMREPNRSEARMGLAYNYFQLDRLKKSAELLKQTLALNPTPNPVWETVSNEIGKLKMQGTARTKLGRIYISQGRYQEALNQFRKVLQRLPELPEALDGLGWSLLHLNRLMEARSAFVHSIKVEPLNNQSHIGLGRVKQSMAREKMGQAKLLSTRLEKNNPQAK